MTKIIEKGIDLKNVPNNKKTWKLFMVAQRSGDKKILSETDALSYVMYADRFSPGGADINDGRIARVDGQRLRDRFYDDPKNIEQLLSQYTTDKQSLLKCRARIFMFEAKELIANLRKGKAKADGCRSERAPNQRECAPCRCECGPRKYERAPSQGRRS